MKNKMRIIAVGAHPDDVEFGCFGTLSYYYSMGNEIFIILFSSGELSANAGIRERESKKSAKMINAKINFLRLPDANIEVNNKTVDMFRNYIAKIKPDMMFVHHPYDRHQDHRATNKICLSSANYFDKVLFYESPSTFNFIPNIYTAIDKHFDKKEEGINAFKSQTKKPYISIKYLKGLAQYRANQCGRFGHLCEAFCCYKWIEG